MTNAYLYYASDPVLEGAGPGEIIDSLYAFYDAGQTAGNSNWGYYGLSEQNYFAGNVGIGTTTPQYPLDVNGTIRATKFIGDGSQLTGIEFAAESDPCFTASPAAGISSDNINNWTTAFGWGDHSLMGYLTSEVDGDTSNELPVAGDDIDVTGRTVSLENDIDVTHVRAAGSGGLYLLDDGGNGGFPAL